SHSGRGWRCRVRQDDSAAELQAIQRPGRRERPWCPRRTISGPLFSATRSAGLIGTTPCSEQQTWSDPMRKERYIHFSHHDQSFVCMSLLDLLYHLVHLSGMRYCPAVRVTVW